MYYTILRMNETITSTHLARHLGDCLAKVKYRHTGFLVTKNEEIIAEIRPAVTETATNATWQEIRNAISCYPADPDFAEDLDIVNRSDRLPENPWD